MNVEPPVEKVSSNNKLWPHVLENKKNILLFEARSVKRRSKQKKGVVIDYLQEIKMQPP